MDDFQNRIFGRFRTRRMINVQLERFQPVATTANHSQSTNEL